MTEVLDSVYLILIFIIIFVELVRKKTVPLDFLTFFHIGFMFWYVLPAFLTAFDPDNAVGDIWLNIKSDPNNLETALAVFAGYLAIVMGFYAKSAQKVGKQTIVKSRGHLLILIYTIFLLLFAWVSIYLYSAPFGGIGMAITQGLEVRGGQIETGELGFFIRFIGGASFASYLLVDFVLNREIKKIKLINLILFIISFLLAVISFMMRAGRLDVIFYFLGFYQIVVLKYRRIPWTFSIAFACFTALFLFYGKNVFASLAAIPDGLDAMIDTFNQSVEGSSQKSGFNIYAFMGNFYYPFFSLNVALSYDYDMRWFLDLLYGAFSLIPDRLIGTEPPQTILYYNTMYIAGRFDFAIPTGLLAFGVYSFWWPGLIIACWVYGWLGGCLQAMLDKHLHEVFWMPSVYALTSQMWVNLQSSDPETFLQSNFIFLASIIFLLGVGAKFSVIRDRSNKKLSKSNNNSQTGSQ
jgi:hypothetical protein